MALRFLLCVAILALAACAPAVTPTPERIEVEVTRMAEITREVEVTREVAVTQLVEITRIVIVTPTATPTPLYTPTITPPPSDTPPPTNTPNVAQTATAQALAKLRSPKGDGFYLVNVDIAPGVWRSQGSGEGCYWATTTRTGNILDNHFGQAGGTMFVPASAFQVELKGCGRWEWLSD